MLGGSQYFKKRKFSQETCSTWERSWSCWQLCAGRENQLVLNLKAKLDFKWEQNQQWIGQAYSSWPMQFVDIKVGMQKRKHWERDFLEVFFLKWYKKPPMCRAFNRCLWDEGGRKVRLQWGWFDIGFGALNTVFLDALREKSLHLHPTPHPRCLWSNNS